MADLGDLADPGLDLGLELDAGSMKGTVFTYSNGCQINSPGDFYTTDYTNAAVDPNSAAILKSVTDVYNTGFEADDGEYALVSKTMSSPTTPVHDTTTYHHSPSPAPYQVGDYIEPNSDSHYFALVATGTAACTAYEYYQANGTSKAGFLSVYDGAAFDTITHAFVATPGQSAGTSGYKAPTAAGIDYQPSAIKKEEVMAGVIGHVMDFTDSPHANCNCYVYPATSDEEVTYSGPTSNTHQLPYGGHIRLKASYTDSSCSAQGQIVLTALKKHGAILRDTDGSSYANHNKLDMVGALGSTSGMGYDFGCLANLRFTDFDVLTLGTVHSN